MPSKYSVLLITVLGTFIMPFMGSSVNIALPSIGNEFNISAITLIWIALSFMLAVAVFLVPFGRLADIHGQKKVFTYGIAIFMAGLLLAAISQTAAVLIAARAVQGVCASMFSATGIAILTSVFPREERGKALSINITGIPRPVARTFYRRYCHPSARLAVPVPGHHTVLHPDNYFGVLEDKDRMAGVKRRAV